MPGASELGDIHIMGKEFARGQRSRLYEVGALVESTAFYVERAEISH